MYRFPLKNAVIPFLISFLFFIGCTKIDTTNLGKDLLPTVDNIHTFDTTLLVTGNNFDDINICDSIVRNDLHALGIIDNDPYFGKTTANIYLELKPKAYPVNIPEYDKDSLFVDSAVIVLQYNHSFGDTNALQKVQVYPLINKFKADSNYTTCNILDYRNILLGEKTYVPAELRDSVHAFRENATNQLRIPIDKFVAEGWLESASTVLATDSAFTINNRGFALVSDAITGGQAINYFNLGSVNTRLSIYARTSKDAKKDTLVIDFSMTGLSGESNSVIRERNNSEITSHLENPEAGDEAIYLQTSPGSHAELKIPGLENLSNRVINRAELVLDQVYSSTTFDELFNVPGALYLDIKDTSGAYIPVPCDFSMDALQNNFSSIGGNARQVKDAEGNTIYRYTFNISRYIQSIVTKRNPNAVIRVRAPYYIQNTKTYLDRCNQLISPFTYGMNFIANGRVKLHGTDGTTSALRLNIVYSKL